MIKHVDLAWRFKSSDTRARTTALVGTQKMIKTDQHIQTNCPGQGEFSSWPTRPKIHRSAKKVNGDNSWALRRAADLQSVLFLSSSLPLLFLPLLLPQLLFLRSNSWEVPGKI
jgi:hypothetical protein